MSGCTKTVTPDDAPRLREIVADLPAASVLCFSEGVYKTALVLDKSVTLRGTGAVLQGRGAPVIVISGKAEVTIEALTLRRGDGGAMGQGGNLSVDDATSVVLRDCVLESGSAEGNGGGGLMARRGEVLVERCRLIGNNGSRASAVLADGTAKVTLRDCIVADNLRSGSGPGAALTVSGEAQLVIERTTVANNDNRPAVEVAPRGGAPTFSAQHSILGDGVSVPASGGSARIASCALSSPLPVGVEDGGNNVVGKIALDAQHHPMPGTIAIGHGAR